MLQYLRKRLAVEELRALHKQVVDGMAAASDERANGFEDTGSTATADEGQEIDWCECGPVNDDRLVY